MRIFVGDSNDRHHEQRTKHVPTWYAAAVYHINKHTSYRPLYVVCCCCLLSASLQPKNIPPLSATILQQYSSLVLLLTAVHLQRSFLLGSGVPPVRSPTPRPGISHHVVRCCRLYPHVSRYMAQQGQQETADHFTATYGHSRTYVLLFLFFLTHILVSAQQQSTPSYD